MGNSFKPKPRSTTMTDFVGKAPSKEKEEEPIDPVAYGTARGLTVDECTNCCSKSLIGSIKPYQKHVILCYKDASTWLPDIKDDGVSSVPFLFNSAIKACGAKFVLTAADHVHSEASSENLAIIVYPEGLVITLPKDTPDFYPLVMELMNGSLSSSRISTPVLWSTVIFVCCHGARDNRCGRAGPQVIEELRTVLSEQSIPETTIAVRSSSHLGGHKFAGVLVVYPQGDWYGLITKRNCKELIDCIQSGKKYLKGWRGNESLDW